jgi:hypothetical protein
VFFSIFRYEIRVTLFGPWGMSSGVVFQGESNAHLRFLLRPKLRELLAIPGTRQSSLRNQLYYVTVGGAKSQRWLDRSPRGLQFCEAAKVAICTRRAGDRGGGRACLTLRDVTASWRHCFWPQRLGFFLERHLLSKRGTKYCRNVGKAVSSVQCFCFRFSERKFEWRFSDHGVCHQG